VLIERLQKDRSSRIPETNEEKAVVLYPAFFAPCCLEEVFSETRI
jgi:hypothetical protein